MIRTLLFLLALLVCAPVAAQTFPPLTGRVVDQADLLSPEQESQLTARLQEVELASSRQLVIATVTSLEDRPIEDYGYQLGRHWGIGQGGTNNGIILLVAPNERKTRIEVGYGLEPIMTDALSNLIITREILPRFRDGDMAGGIIAGADAIIAQLQAPPEEAERRAVEAAAAGRNSDGEGGSFFPLIFWVVVLAFFIVPMLRSGFRGKRYGRGRGAPVIIWGPGLGGWSGDSSGGSSWGGSSWGGSSGGGSFGGFSGGGGSFGGGGASGGW